MYGIFFEICHVWQVPFLCDIISKISQTEIAENTHVSIVSGSYSNDAVRIKLEQDMLLWVYLLPGDSVGTCL